MSGQLLTGRSSGTASPVPEAGSRLSRWPCCGGAAMTNMLVPCSIMQLVDAIDDAPGCDSLDVDGVNALVDLLGVLDDAAIDPNGAVVGFAISKAG
jgi:hypothetical protein